MEIEVWRWRCGDGGEDGGEDRGVEVRVSFCEIIIEMTGGSGAFDNPLPQISDNRKTL